MESPLKERLTGALIVVAVLVIVVPEMLSGPERSTATVRTDADAGPPERTFSLELGSNAAAPTQDQSALTPQSTEPVAVTEPAPPPAPAAVNQGESPVATVTVPAPATRPRAAPADVKPAAPPVVDATATGNKGQWWTQLGSFSARDNAERLARDLRAQGHTINIARLEVGNKDLYRVRAGPVASREAAVALQSRLAAAGHKSSLVPP